MDKQKTLREWVEHAEKNKKCIGHFNVATLDMFWAVYESAQAYANELGEPVPVVIGTSEGERDFLGMNQMVHMVHKLREDTGYPIFINADHTYSVEKSKQAIDAGYDMVIIDVAEGTYEENRDAVAEVVQYRNEANNNTLVEAELGFIGSGSNIKDELPDGVDESTKTDPAQAKQFVAETGVDMLAPSVGNVHGMVKSGNPRLDPDRVTLVRKFAGVPLVLHGGSGSTDPDFTSAIQAGISMIHISTEMRLAYRQSLERAFTQNPNQLAPYKYLSAPKEAVAQVVSQRIRLFWA